MTRQITITNTSNWDHEDYVVGRSGPAPDHLLRPGESTTFYPGEDETISFEAVEKQKPEPFYETYVDDFGCRKDRQIMPRVRTVFKGA